MQERVKDAANLDALLLEEFIKPELEEFIKSEDERDEEKESWGLHIMRIIVRIVAIFILILVIIWGIMKIF
jgi:flagellar biogenesis protein FliO